MCSGGSFEDIHINVNDLYFGPMEEKETSVPIQTALLQAVVIATHFCLGLLNRGVARNECIVPVVATNGLVIIFGATMMLADSC